MAEPLARQLTDFSGAGLSIRLEAQLFHKFDREPFAHVTPDWPRLRRLLLSGRVRTESDKASDRAPGLRRPVLASSSLAPSDLRLLLDAAVTDGYETGSSRDSMSCAIHLVSTGKNKEDPEIAICTDLPLDIDERVYPWHDEGELLLGLIGDNGNVSRALNMFCGAGTIAIGLSARFPGLVVHGADINERALKYAMFNAQINLDAGRQPRWMLTDGFEGVSENYDLITGVPPFALQPPGAVEHTHSAGGPDGLQMVRRMLDGAHLLSPGGELKFLSYALGDSHAPTNLIDLLNTRFPDGGWRVQLLPSEKVWRVGAFKRFTNPMPVRYMVSRLADHTYRASESEPFALWENWIEKDLIEAGRTHLHFVFVTYTAPS